MRLSWIRLAPECHDQSLEVLERGRERFWKVLEEKERGHGGQGVGRAV